MIVETSLLKWAIGGLATLALMWFSGLSTVVYSNEKRIDGTESLHAVVIEKLDNIEAAVSDVRSEVKYYNERVFDRLLNTPCTANLK